MFIIFSETAEACDQEIFILQKPEIYWAAMAAQGEWCIFSPSQI